MAGWVRVYGFVGNRHWSAGFPSDHRTWRIGPPWLTAHRNLSGFSLSRVTGYTSLMGLPVMRTHGSRARQKPLPASPDFGHGHHPRRIGFPGFRVDSISGSLSRSLTLPLSNSDSPSLKLSLRPLKLSVSRSSLFLPLLASQA
jgi:hypothetical protein